MARNGLEMAIYESQIFFFFLTKLKKTETKKIVFYLIVFDPIEISTRLAPQNVHQNIR